MAKAEGFRRILAYARVASIVLGRVKLFSHFSLQALA